jgi:hypothetical protein
MMNILSGTLSYRAMRVGLLLASLLVIVISIAQAVELPPDSSAAFIQTSGPNTPLNIGDYYTSTDGAGEPHFLRFNLPCTWPGDQPVTVALFDPEVQEPDPALSDPPPADDEIRDDTNTKINNPPDENIQFADVTTYTLFAIRPGDVVEQVISPATFVATSTVTATTNGRWVELVTFTPNTPNFGCGVYAVAAVTSDNDDNAWKLAVSYDPDCTVSVPNPGTCSGIGQTQSDLLSNGNEQDDADGIVGTGDELILSLDQISYQHEGPDRTCQTFYHPVYEDDVPEVLFHNFDLDINNSIGSDATVRHISPSGVEIAGTASNNRAWNNAGDPPPFPPERGGDLIQIGPDDLGLWLTEICVSRDNQYIFEGQQDEIVFMRPPPLPVLTVSKDDGRTIVEPGELLTYVVVFTNVSDTNPRPIPPPPNTAPPGAAFNVSFTDELPDDTTFVACQINPPYTGTCDETSPGIVTARLNEVVVAGAGGNFDLTVEVNADAPPGLLTDTVRADYTGILGIAYPPETDTDIDEILPPPPATPVPTSTPDEGDREKDTPTPLPPTPTAVVIVPTPTPLPVAFLPETGIREGVSTSPIVMLAVLTGLVIALVTAVRFLPVGLHNQSAKQADEQTEAKRDR